MIGVEKGSKRENVTISHSYPISGAIIVSVITAVFLTHLIAASPIRAVEFMYDYIFHLIILLFLSLFSLDDPPVLEKNLRLTQSSIILENAVYGPESIAEDPKTGRSELSIRIIH